MLLTRFLFSIFSRGTLLEHGYRAEQLGRAAQPAFELSKEGLLVGGQRVPNICPHF